MDSTALMGTDPGIEALVASLQAIFAETQDAVLRRDEVLMVMANKALRLRLSERLSIVTSAQASPYWAHLEPGPDGPATEDPCGIRLRLRPANGHLGEDEVMVDCGWFTGVLAVAPPELDAAAAEVYATLRISENPLAPDDALHVAQHCSDMANPDGSGGT
jgi:hypothetical protein